MGLLDEAIAEFQKALRAPKEAADVRSARCLFLRERGIRVAESILRRGLDLPAGGDQERLGVLYWLARALQDQGKAADARSLRPRVRRGHPVPRRRRAGQGPRQGEVNVSQQVARVALRDIQRPVALELEHVVDELRRIIAADFPIIADVNEHLLRMKGKLFRPRLLLLSHRAAGGQRSRATTLAAVVELIHLATLVHDDSWITRRCGAHAHHQRPPSPTRSPVIMGDYLYSRAIIELVGLEDLEPLRVFARVTNEMTVGEMRQLEAHDKLAYGESQYDALIRAKTASLLSGACEVGALRAAPRYREALARFGLSLGMAFQITDDLLDYTQPEAVTGKPSGLDLRSIK